MVAGVGQRAKHAYPESTADLQRGVLGATSEIVLSMLMSRKLTHGSERVVHYRQRPARRFDASRARSSRTPLPLGACQTLVIGLCGTKCARRSQHAVWGDREVRGDDHAGGHEQPAAHGDRDRKRCSEPDA